MKKIFIFIAGILLGAAAFSFDLAETLKANIGHDIAGIIYKNPGIGSYPHGVIVDVEDGWLISRNGKDTSYIWLDSIAAISISKDVTRK